MRVSCKQVNERLAKADNNNINHKKKHTSEKKKIMNGDDKNGLRK